MVVPGDALTLVPAADGMVSLLVTEQGADRALTGCREHWAAQPVLDQCDPLGRSEVETNARRWDDI